MPLARSGRTLFLKKFYKKDLPKLFELIAEAKLPDGQLPFDPEDYRQNGQALPSDTSDANGKATFDLAQHNDSHPQVNEAMRVRLATIDADLSRKLARRAAFGGAQHAVAIFVETGEVAQQRTAIFLARHNAVAVGIEAGHDL